MRYYDRWMDEESFRRVIAHEVRCYHQERRKGYAIATGQGRMDRLLIDALASRGKFELAAAARDSRAR